MSLSRLGSGLLSVALLLPPAGTAFALPLPQGTTSIPAVDVTAADFQATLESSIETGATDTPIRTIDAGGHHVGVALVHRGPVANVVAGTIHSEVTEVYSVLEGSGTLVTGGRLLDPQPRELTALRRRCRGPGGQVAAWKARIPAESPRATSSSSQRARRTISPRFRSRLPTPSCGSTRAGD